MIDPYHYGSAFPGGLRDAVGREERLIPNAVQWGGSVTVASIAGGGTIRLVEVKIAVPMTMVVSLKQNPEGAPSGVVYPPVSVPFANVAGNWTLSFGSGGTLWTSYPNNGTYIIHGDTVLVSIVGPPSTYVPPVGFIGWQAWCSLCYAEPNFEEVNLP